MPRRWINCRVIVRVCGLLLLGAVLTVAAAWAPALWYDFFGEDSGNVSAVTNDDLQWWRATVSADADHELTKVVRRDRVSLGFDLVSMYSIKEVLKAEAFRGRFGFPLQSLEYSQWELDPYPFRAPAWQTRGCWILNRGGATIITFPLIPIWSGFGIDTLFFAALSTLILAGWRRLIRRRRLKRGRCPACKYPIGTSPVCTECGEALVVVAKCAVSG